MDYGNDSCKGGLQLVPKLVVPRPRPQTGGYGGKMKEESVSIVKNEAGEVT